jgi:hypothetical protein
MPLHDPVQLSAALAVGAVLALAAYALVCSLLIVTADAVRRRRPTHAPDPAYV